MKKQYDIHEIFEFEVGTKVSCERGEFMTVTLGEDCKSLAPIKDTGICGLSDRWLKMKFELIEDWEEVSFMEAMEAYNLRKTILCETQIKDKIFNFNDKELQRITDIGDDEEFMHLIFKGKWFIKK